MEDRIRRAGPEDAAVLARQRGKMFLDMGACVEAEADAIRAASVGWFETQLWAGEFAGWLTVRDSVVVAGGGMHLRAMGPVPGMCREGGGHIANVYVEPEQRGRGVARDLMQTMIAWAEADGIDRLTLAASSAGEALYRSMGFTRTNEMELVLFTSPGRL